MKRALSIALLACVSSLAWAQDEEIDPNQISCKTFSMHTDVKTYVQYIPSYFTKSVPVSFDDKRNYFQGLVAETEYLATYIADTGGDNNRIVRLNSDDDSNREIEVPGPYDPVPSADGRILSVADPMRIYDIREFLIEGHTPQPLLDGIISGVYQSVAWLRGKALESSLKNFYRGQTCTSRATGGPNCLIELKGGKMDFNKQRIYRMVVDHSQHIPIIDILVDFKPNCNVRETVKRNPDDHCITATVLGRDNTEPGSFPYCGNTALKTLFISRQGTYIAGFDASSGYATSKIYDISEAGQCRMVMDIGYPTGKIDFNDNEDKIIFHLDYLNSHAGGYFSGVDSMRTKDVFIMDLEKQEPLLVGKRLMRYTTSVERGTGCYYPSFFNEQVKNASGQTEEKFLCMYDEGDDEEGNYSFRMVDITGLFSSVNHPLVPRENAANQTEEQKIELHVGATLGLVWGQLCNPEDEDEYSAIDAASTFLNIDGDDCDKITAMWETDKDLQDRIANDMRFEDDPRFGDAAYVKSEVTSRRMRAACLKAKRHQNQLGRHSQGRVTHTYGTDAPGEFKGLTGAEIARNKCSGCHHYNIPLGAVLSDDFDAGNKFFPNALEFGHEKDRNGLMQIDASLERIGYNPLIHMQEDPIIAERLGHRMMPPAGRVTLRQVGDYDERKILAKYLYEIRQQKINALNAQQGGQR